MLHPTVKLIVACAVMLGATSPAAAQDEPRRFKTDTGEVLVEIVASRLVHPWGLAFLPDGRMLVTERPGRLRIVSDNGRLSEPLRGVPPVFARGQGGLLDVALDPDFAGNRLVYLTFAEPRQGGAGTSVARGRLNESGTALEGTEIIFRQQPAHSGPNHFGSRLAFDGAGHLYVALGDRFDLMEEAQDPSNHLGKVVRIRPDGSVPADNPGASRQGWAPEVWSIGHRNIQAAAVRPGTNQLWTIEHGARGGDEVNRPMRGRNYGWPVISYGRHYSGARIGEGTQKPGLEQPVFYWDPSIAPSGMTFYTGGRFPQWRGDIILGALRGQMIVRLDVEGDRVVGEHRMLQGLGQRIRAVAQGPDGYLYLLTDADDGRILRVRPADGRG